MDAPIQSPSHAAGAAGSSMSTAAATSARPSPSNSTASVSIPAPPPPAQIKKPSTDALLKDFSLVAEAAKRAQVAVMTRDFEDCGI